MHDPISEAVVEPAPAKGDCYSAGERGWMEYGQRARAIWLGPLLVGCTSFGVTPDLITLLSGLLGLAFVPLWISQTPGTALLLLWMHVLLDGLDGPLARHQKIDSTRGSFTDTFCDQVVVTAVMIAWMITIPAPINIAAGSAYVFLYGLVVAMAMVRNAMQVPYSWLVRPRFFVYASLTIDWIFGSQFVLLTLIVCNLLLAIKTASGFWALRQRLPGPS